MRRALPAILLATVLVATACGGGGSTTDDDGPTASTDDVAAGPRVVVTTTILGDLVAELVGSDGRVEVLMQPGQDPHGFSASARQAASLRDADLIVANGLQLEESLLDALDAAEADGARVVRVAESLDPLTFTPGHAEDDGHDHEGPDPHVWYDPVRMADAVVLLGDELAAVDDALDDDVWTTRGAELAEQVLAVHDEVEEILAAVPEACRRLVTSHDSFGYFAARYDFEVVGTVIPGTSTAAEPSAREFAELADLVAETGVPAIFTETTQTARLSEALAAEVGGQVQVVSLFTDAVGEPGSGADTYLGMLRTNAERIADALRDC